ncbi:MAG: cob(I)yrinic acid a,c-diamide adenosyltransferase [Gammaproteobacteria bacterium]|nr:cob(I)yrinic acid a,c-diamide adenosyltransferase [Gammaproteobacteria bacterium]
MVNISKVYTKTGDDGSTSLAANRRVRKDSDRIAVIGNVDELNSAVGFAAQAMKDHSELGALHDQCLVRQQQLFNLGAQLCVMLDDRREDTPLIVAENINALETEIDSMNKSLPKLKSFILPGGGEVAVRLHLARAVCRRAERSCVALGHEEPLDGVEIPYLNRLSDWLFVAARYAAHMESEGELLWEHQ